MTSIRVVLRKKPNSAGLYPLAVRITKNRASSYISTGQYIAEKHWNADKREVRKSHPNSRRLNHTLAKTLAEVSDRLLELERLDAAVSAQTITSRARRRKKHLLFFDVAKLYLDDLVSEEKFGRVKTDGPRLKYFRHFLGGRNIPCSDITAALLKRFKTYLMTTRGVSERTVMNYLIVIRTVYNRAIREGAAHRKDYPFGRGKIVIKFPESVKIGLSAAEVAALEHLALDDPAQRHARALWLFSFYFAGMRVSDMLTLRWSDFHDGRLHYRMGKNEKPVSLEVTGKAAAILDHYAPHKTAADDYVFPALRRARSDDAEDRQRKIANATKTLNKHLKRIAAKMGLQKPLTMHIARHSFGTISGDKIPVQMLQKLYRHSSILTTINYQNAFIHKSADDALKSVIDVS